MPTFSAIALDRLLDPGASKSLTWARNKDKDNNNSDPNTTSDELRWCSKKLDIQPHPGQGEKKTTMRPQMSPALYATPEPTPLPDSPTSFPPSSPYIINHKRRGPRLLKTFSEKNVPEPKEADLDDPQPVPEPEPNPINSHSRSFSLDTVFTHVDPDNRCSNADFSPHKVVIDAFHGQLRDDIEISDPKLVIASSFQRDFGDNEDFFDPQDSMSFTSNNTDGEECGAATKFSASAGEFFDAAEELSSDSGRQPQRTITDVEIELREMRLSLLMEIERRKQAEEAFNSMRSRWEILREKLRSVGLIVPADLSDLSNGQSDIDPAEEICRQIHIARFVSESIGRGFAKAEAEAEIEAQLEVKNFEIARLSDRLNYYEAMNREMSQRNQEAIEAARSQRQKRRRRQKWVWGSIAAAITIGSAALTWSYIPTGRGSSSSDSLEASKTDINLQ